MRIALAVLLAAVTLLPRISAGEAAGEIPLHKQGEAFHPSLPKNQLYDPAVAVEPGGAFGEKFEPYRPASPALYDARVPAEPGGAHNTAFEPYLPPHPALYDAGALPEPGGAYNTEFEPYRPVGEIFIDPEEIPGPGDYWTDPVPGRF